MTEKQKDLCVYRVNQAEETVQSAKLCKEKHDEWENNLRKWKQQQSVISKENLPHGVPKFLGYVTQQHNIRDTKSGMTRGWSIFGDQVDKAVRTNIVGRLV